MKNIFGHKIESNIIISRFKYNLSPEQLNDRISCGDKLYFKVAATKYNEKAIKIICISSTKNQDINLGYLPNNIAILVAPICYRIEIKGEVITTYNLKETEIIIIKICIEFLKQKWLSSFVNINNWTKAWKNLDSEIKKENIQANLLMDEINIMKKCLLKEIVDYDNAVLNLKRISNQSILIKEAHKLLSQVIEKKRIHDKKQELKRIIEAERLEKLDELEAKKKEIRIHEINSKRISEGRSEKDNDRSVYNALVKREKCLTAKLQDENNSEETCQYIESQLLEIKNKKEELCKKWNAKVPPSKPVISSINPSYNRLHRFY